MVVSCTWVVFFLILVQGCSCILYPPLLRGYKIQQPKPVKIQRGCTLWILPCEAGGAVSAKVIFPAGRRMPTALPHRSLDGCPCPCFTPLPGRIMPVKSKLVNSEWLRVCTLAGFFPDIKKRELPVLAVLQYINLYFLIEEGHHKIQRIRAIHTEDAAGTCTVTIDTERGYTCNNVAITQEVGTARVSEAGAAG